MFDLLELVSFDKSDSFDDESDDDGSDSGCIGTCAFTFRSDGSIGSVGESVGGIRGVGSGILSQQDLSKLVTLFYWSCLYQNESSQKVVDS